MQIARSIPRRISALSRGFACHCPNCGQARLFSSYLTLTKSCDHCAEDFSMIRADDLPAYLTIAVVGHVVVGLMLATVQWGVANWLGISVSLLTTLCLTLWLLPRIKGAVAAHLWLLRLSAG